MSYFYLDRCTVYEWVTGMPTLQYCYNELVNIRRQEEGREKPAQS